MENPTAAIVKRYLDKNPLLGEYLARGLINYSALARELLPLVLQENPKARIESVLIAIQRYVPSSFLGISTQIHKILSTTEVSLTSDIVQVVFERTKENRKRIFEIVEHKREDGSLCTIEENREQISVFLSEHLLPLFKGLLAKHKVLHKDLAVLGLHETQIGRSLNSQKVSGYLAYLCLLFMEHSINIVELITCHAHILIFVDEKDSSKAYDVLGRHIREVAKKRKSF